MKNLMKNYTERTFDRERMNNTFRTADGTVRFDIMIDDTIYTDCIGIYTTAPVITFKEDILADALNFAYKGSKDIDQYITIYTGYDEDIQIRPVNTNTWVPLTTFINTTTTSGIDIDILKEGTIWKITIDDDERFNNTTCIIMNTLSRLTNTHMYKNKIADIMIGVVSNNHKPAFTTITIHINDETINKIHMEPVGFCLESAEWTNLKYPAYVDYPRDIYTDKCDDDECDDQDKEE